jgi:phosphatidylserine decarboxylase
LSVLDPHINRIPAGGRLEYVKYVPGKFFKAFEDKASEENEHTEIGLAFGTNRMIFKQIAGILARRIVCNVKSEQEVKAGEIFGMIHFGSRAELFLPDNVEILVKPGDRVKAGESLIGRIVKR